MSAPFPIHTHTHTHTHTYNLFTHHLPSFITGEPGSDKEEDKVTQETEKKKEEFSTKKPAILPLPEENTVMQIDCGTFHSGDCHMINVLHTHVITYTCTYMYIVH